MAKTTSVIINTSSFQKSVTFVVDIGSELNLLKSSVIRSKEVIDDEKTIKIRGITSNHIYTRDSIVVNIFDRLIPFHIVDLIFLIEQDGILSSKYLKKSQRKRKYAKECLEPDGREISFINRESVYIPTRLSCFQCKVANLQVEEDYISRLDILTRIYTTDVLIKNRHFMYLK
ncbi:hypothetical protein HZH68_015710 [Vespula germanica]|uniref:Peptidase A2 domain-containing protein n=1 Tax=Vespula germanica TaxID=30212 RepID=A0A834J775_VESGE|nr:hypothetical protein HZH68_015710 [Vespula germanica]